MPESEQSRGGPAGEALLFVAGLADLAADHLGAVVERGRAVLGRSDVADLAGQGHQEVRARGRLVLERFAAPPAYLELVARHAATRGNG